MRASLPLAAGEVIFVDGTSSTNTSTRTGSVSLAPRARSGISMRAFDCGHEHARAVRHHLPFAKSRRSTREKSSPADFASTRNGSETEAQQRPHGQREPHPHVVALDSARATRRAQA